MKYRKLGADLTVSLLGYGGWQLGGDGWLDVDLREAIRTLEHCLEAGITYFDTAPIYGYGKSEERLGEVLRAVRKDILIGTKCGLKWEGTRVYRDTSRDSVLRDIEGSLSRLKTDYIDLYQVHWLDGRTPLSEVLSTMEALRKAGVVRHIGLCNVTGKDIREAVGTLRLASVQSEYNLVNRQAEKEVLPTCQELGVGFIAHMPLAQGLLTGAFTRETVLDKADARNLNRLFRNRWEYEACLRLVRKLKEPPARAALEFLGENPVVSSLIVGMPRERDLRENLLIVNSITEEV